jgi:hypothetical protein
MTERWHQNGFNTWEVIIIRNGPDAQGHNYVDGRHQIHVAYHESAEAAAAACAEHNAELAQ